MAFQSQNVLIISARLLILRHKPEAIGITLDEHGWADARALIDGVNATGRHHLTQETLEEIVCTDEKQRYAFNEGHTRIRANQGHSISVDVELEQRTPPPVLYHGTDGVTKEEYNANIDANLEKLVEQMKQFRYRPMPVRRTYIPKANGKLRPLGIPAYEDKLVQGAMAKLLEEVYEPRFLDCSYGFRKGRSCHDVVRYICKTGMTGKVNYVLEADIKGFFDNVNHEWLMRFLEMDIADKRFLRYVRRFLLAGIMEDGKYTESDKGTPQGGLISPVLANVYLHYVLDTWFELEIKHRLHGETYYVRYADDFLIMFQYENDAKAVMNVIPKRLARFSLEVAPEKTRIMPFGRFKGTGEAFDFLGFTFFETKARKKRKVPGWYQDEQEEAEGQEAGGQSMAAATADQADSKDNGKACGSTSRPLQLLRDKW